MDNPPARVLVIEDEAGARANLCDILELDRYLVETAGTVQEALTRRNWSGISAIVLDRKLPDGNADELVPKLRTLAPAAAVIIVTGYSDLEGAIAALRQGAADYLIKPINADLLRASLARVIERQRMAAELEDARARALQAERLAAIGEVYTGLAHESRNALQRSQACLERLAKRVRDQPEALDLIDRIQRAQDHLHQLYEEVRTYAAPFTQSQGHPCDLVQLLQRTWDHLEPVRQKRRAQLVQIADIGVDVRCAVDKGRIEQVFRNILENALSACQDPVTITATWSDANEADEPAVRVAIRDNGPGLSNEACQRIFEPFYTTKTHGTGLGMAIAKRIIDAHGGQLFVGNPTTGAEINVILPRGST